MNNKNSKIQSLHTINDVSEHCGAPHHPPEHRPLSKSGPRAARFRLATIPSLISPEPWFDPRRGLLWLLGGNRA